MKKCNNLFLFFSFFFLVVFQLNIGMNQELEKSETMTHQNKKFFYCDETNNEMKIILKLNKEFQGKVSQKLVFEPFKKIVESLRSEEDVENFDGYLEKYLHNLHQASSKDKVKDGLSFNQSLLLKIKKQFNDIKKNKGKYTVGAFLLAVLTAGGYYFRQGIGRNITKVKNYSKNAWKYAKEKAVNFT